MAASAEQKQHTSSQAFPAGVVSSSDLEAMNVTDLLAPNRLLIKGTIHPNLYPERILSEKPSQTTIPIWYQSHLDLPQDIPSGLQANPFEHESLLSEDQSYRETVGGSVI